VWFLPITNGQSAADFRVQRFHGEPVITWSQEQGLGGLAKGLTTDYILDRHYRIVATVTAGNGLDADAHEFNITPEDTALITVYNAVTRDLTSVGGAANGLVIDGIVQEIDIASGRVLLEWHSLDHVSLEESHQPLPASPTAPYDYFHINAVSLDEDGNLLISSRHTWTVYKLDRHTGTIIWRLGGDNSDFTLGPNVPFAWQHNPIAVDRDTIRLFDNESSGTPVVPESRVIWIRRNVATKTATLLQSFVHPDRLSAGSQGGSQALQNGDTFVGWGSVPRISEFDRNGNLIFDASLPAGYDTYRAYRFEWEGQPDTRPAAVVSVNGGITVVHAIWNGATDVARWDVVGNSGRERDIDESLLVGSSPWNGLDTAISIDGKPKAVRVVARNRFGREIASSPVTAIVE